jgi:hypothetical protein
MLRTRNLHLTYRKRKWRVHPDSRPTGPEQPPPADQGLISIVVRQADLVAGAAITWSATGPTMQ